MSGDSWFKFFSSDFLSGVAALSAAERGVYITLLALMYDNGGPIKRDDGRLSRICGLPKAGFSRALDSLIGLGKIVIEGECLANSRVKTVLTERVSRGDAARKGALSRWEKTQQNQSQSDANALRPQCASNADSMLRARVPEPEPDKKILEASPLVEAGASTDEAAVVVSISRKPDPARKETIRAFGEWWNDLASALGFPQIDRIEGNREVAALQRARRLREDYGTVEDGLRFLEAKIRGSPFLQGKTGWRGFSFDWCLKAANFQKIVEGNYEREIQQARRR